MAIQDDDLLLVNRNGDSFKATWAELKDAGTGGTGSNGYWDRTGTILSPVNAGDSLVLNDGTGTASVDLDAGTSAAPLVRDSSGRLLVGTPSTSQNVRAIFQGGTAAGQPGTLVLARDSDTANQDDTIGLLRLTGNAHNGGAQIRCAADGAAWSAGSSQPTRFTFETTPSGSTTPVERCRIDSAGNFLLGGTLPASPNISLNANGSATFAGTVITGSYDGASTAVSGARITASGMLTLQRQSGALPDNRFQILDGTTVTAGIANDGSAEFAKAVHINPTIVAGLDSETRLIVGESAATDRPMALFYSSDTDYRGIGIRVQHRNTTNANAKFFQGVLGTNETAAINADGSATFRQEIVAGDNPSTSNSNPGARVNVFNGGTTGWVSAYRGGFLCFQNDGNTSTSTVTINASNGTATFTGNVTAPNITSDIRFKENLTPASSQLDDVKQLSALLKNWDWNDQAPMNEELRAQRFLGLVAQEAEKVCPHISYEVKRTKQGKELTPAVLDNDGAVVTEATYEELDDSYKALKHDVILMKMLGTVGELIAKNEALEAKVAVLEAKVG